MIEFANRLGLHEITKALEMRRRIKILKKYQNPSENELRAGKALLDEIDTILQPNQEIIEGSINEFKARNRLQKLPNLDLAYLAIIAGLTERAEIRNKYQNDLANLPHPNTSDGQKFYSLGDTCQTLESYFGGTLK